MSEYSEKLKDPRWQKKRLKIMHRDDFQCRYCGNGEETLHVHHIGYTDGLEPWEYENRDLITLCETCHNFEHVETKNIEKYLRMALHKTGIPPIIGVGFLSFLIEKHRDSDFGEFIRNEQSSADVKSIFGKQFREFIKGL